MQVGIAGAGVAGLTAALALARQGHRVQVFDRDTTPRPGDVTAAESWQRRGVPQFHQPHNVLARVHAELTAALPDVVEALVTHGAGPVPLPDGLTGLWCRRSTLEWVLRTLVEDEPGITLRPASVAGVEVDDGRDGAVVRGVTLGDGEVVPADLVVDATGRRGRLSRAWLHEEVDVPADEVYASRRYRLLPGAEFGTVNRNVISVAEGDGYALLVFPHDAGTFTVCFTRLPDDPELALLRDTAAFEAATRLVPLAAEWTDPARARPVSPVMVMSGLRSRFCTLGGDAPLGLHPLADVICTTNPHFGRGVALAVSHALRLAGAVAAAPGDPRAWRAQVEAWVHGELRAWFDDARKTDLARAQVWRAVRDGRPPTSGPAAGGNGTVPHLLVLAAAGADPVVGRAVLRHMHLVDPPAALDAVRPRVADMLAGGWLPGRPAPGPGSRRDGAVAVAPAAAPGATGPRPAGEPAAERPAGPPPGAPVAPPRRRLVEVLASAAADAVPS
jgi:2-polyprenyl-6-methoxyphenol hydroxylase-like FAD-dependent oxidoreductase